MIEEGLAKAIGFIPGENPKPPTPQYREQILRCISHAIRRVDAETALDFTHCHDVFRLIGWNHNYYQANRNIDQDIPAIEALLKKSAASRNDIREIHGINARSARRMYEFAVRHPGLSRLLPNRSVRDNFRELETYFGDQLGVLQRTRNFVRKELRDLLGKGVPVLLIAHGLGSVIAYETLWELSRNERYESRVDLFLTIGSPLGLPGVQDRLMGAALHGAERYPDLIRDWVNVTAVGDLRAADTPLKERFGEMLKLGLIQSITDHTEGIYNVFRSKGRLNAHHAYGYLVDSTTARIITKWWKIGRR